MTDGRLTAEQNEFLERLKIHKANGVRIIIDGMETPEIEWDKIFTLADRSPDGSTQFYMSDYVTGTDGGLNEIRLDKFQIKGI